MTQKRYNFELAGRSTGRYEDGIYPDQRLHDGDSQWRPRSRFPSPLPEHHYENRDFKQIVNYEARLLSVSENPADMQMLLEIQDHDPVAAQAGNLSFY